jgi:hypothetical protein
VRAHASRAVLLGFAIAVSGPIGGAEASPILDAAHAEEVAAQLAEATAVQGICYGWQVRIDDDDGTYSGTELGSSRGVGLAAEHPSCPRFMVFRADLHYTSESSESSDSALFYVFANVGGGPDEEDLRRVGISGEALLGDKDDLAIANAVLALPAPPTAPPDGPAPTGYARTAPSSSSLRRCSSAASDGRVGPGRRSGSTSESTLCPNEGACVEDLRELAEGMLSGLGYGLVGMLLLAVGYKVLDALLPGDLGALIYTDRNTNAALVVGSAILALGAIVTTAIVTSDDEFIRGLGNTAGYGLLGVALLALAFVLADRLTPGALGTICTDPEPHPAVYVTVASHLAVGAILAAAIS